MEYDPSETAGIMALLGTFFLIFGLISLFIIACYWKIFTKAGKPGWAAIIPIYNTIVLLEIVGKPVWWFFLLLIPIVNIVFAIMLVHELSLSFGQGVGMTLLLLFLPIVGFPMLAFGSAQYNGPSKVVPQPI